MEIFLDLPSAGAVFPPDLVMLRPGNFPSLDEADSFGGFLVVFFLAKEGAAVGADSIAIVRRPVCLEVQSIMKCFMYFERVL